MELIGLTGFSGSGKNETANILAELFDFEVIAFADPLREMLYWTNPDLVSGRTIRALRDVIDEYGWEGYKETRWKNQIRELMQRLGTDAGRRVLGEDVWVNQTMERVQSKDKVCITDIRFYNEFREVALNPGYVWRVDRPGVEALNAHESESYIDKFPVNEVINNDDTLLHLRRQVVEAYSNMLQ